MICRKCGAGLKETSKFCVKCGAKVHSMLNSLEEKSISTVQYSESQEQLVSTSILQSQQRNNSLDTSGDKDAYLTVATYLNRPIAECADTLETSSSGNTNRSTNTENKTEQVEYTASQNSEYSKAPPRKKSKLLAGVLGIVVGALGIHWFYLGKTKRGWIYLVFYIIAIQTIEPIGYLFIYLCRFEGLLLLLLGRKSYERYINII